jgi:hypothetical protein
MSLLSKQLYYYTQKSSYSIQTKLSISSFEFHDDKWDLCNNLTLKLASAHPMNHCATSRSEESIVGTQITQASTTSKNNDRTRHIAVSTQITSRHVLGTPWVDEMVRTMGRILSSGVRLLTRTMSSVSWWSYSKNYRFSSHSNSSWIIVPSVHLKTRVP